MSRVSQVKEGRAGNLLNTLLPEYCWSNSETTEAGPGYRVTAFCWWFKKVNKLFINPSEGLIIITSHKMNS